ncbi:hypothetical protein MMC13_002876 [Lambiella insularis]|nr:hypothetical protein [Lambiella insularis]
MADVRSLLRNERASRRIIHPQASYSGSGALSCRICQLQLKSESLWDLHIKSSQHLKRLRQTQDGAVHGSMTSRKRKANDSEADEDLRKRPKAQDTLPEGFFDAAPRNAALDESQEARIEETSAIPDPSSETKTTAPQVTSPVEDTNTSLPSDVFDSATKEASTVIATVDEEEWAAFKRDVARLATPPPAPSALMAQATITAAPLTAAEIAAKSREEASTQAKERQEAELEGEKEDASRRLEEEFDEMEELEERVKRLREKREQLRRRRDEETGAIEAEAVVGDHAGQESEDGAEDEEEDDDDEDGWDGWGIR